MEEPRMPKRSAMLHVVVLGAALGIMTGGCGDSASTPTGSSADVEAGADKIVLHLEYGTGVGGALIVEYRPYLMFSDGAVYKNLATSVDNLVPALSQASEPDEWGTWKKTGSTFELSWHDGETETWAEDEWFDTRPAATNLQLEGSFHSISGGGNTALGGDVTTFSMKNISFDGDRFTFEATSGGSTSNVTAYSSKDKAGTYRLDGNTVELRFNNGELERKFFYFYPDSDDVFGIGDEYYIKDDDPPS
jgi:hypothetical protein